MDGGEMKIEKRKGVNINRLKVKDDYELNFHQVYVTFFGICFPHYLCVVGSGVGFYHHEKNPLSHPAFPLLLEISLPTLAHRERKL